jgi:signal transduction histidine kinase
MMANHPPARLAGQRRQTRVEREKAAERSARAVMRLSALGEMTGGIAHDLRNILAVIASGLRLAKRNRDDAMLREASLAAAEDGVRRGLNLVARLLAYPGPPDKKTLPQDVNSLLRNLEAFLKYGAGPGNQVILELAPALPECQVDPAQFNAAILNLVTNARDALEQGGIIHLSTQTVERDLPSGGQRDFVEVRIRDNGIGMPPEVMSRIFDRFFTTKGERGTGLGVPQVQALMRRIGGDVEVRSSPGMGTTFSLLFPTLFAGAPDTPDAWRQVDRWANEGGAITGFPALRE